VKPRALASAALWTLLGVAAHGSEPTEPEDDAVRWELYGYLKTDASFDSSLINPGNFARWVESDDLARDHTHFNLTVRETRLGLRLEAPRGEGPRFDGHVEVDFYGGGPENRNILQLRHAHMDVTWDSGWHVLLGQYSDVISPLTPRTVNYPVAWWAGNIGYRRPQMRLTKRTDVGETRSLVVAVAATRTIGDDFAAEPGDSGVDSGHPTVQSRLGYSWQAGRGGLGISGHWGREDLSVDFDDPHLQFDSWSLGVDALIPMGRLTVKLEAWHGENLDDYLGGIASGVNLGSLHGVRASGGWLSLEYARDRLAGSVGAGVDDPEDDDLEEGARSRNRVVWGNAFYDVTPHFTTAVEVSYWHTRYRGRPAGEAVRLQLAALFRF